MSPGLEHSSCWCREGRGRIVGRLRALVRGECTSRMARPRNFFRYKNSIVSINTLTLLSISGPADDSSCTLTRPKWLFLPHQTCQPGPPRTPGTKGALLSPCQVRPGQDSLGSHPQPCSEAPGCTPLCLHALPRGPGGHFLSGSLTCTLGPPWSSSARG